MSTTRVFVYGTLLRGERNHALLGESRLVGLARTAARYVLVSLGHHPAMAIGGSDAIAGELYDVEPDVLARLDVLEEHPTWYERVVIELDDPERAHGRVEGYVLPPDEAARYPRIPSGDWRVRTGR